MGFKDLFQQKLKVEQDKTAEVRTKADRALSEHEQLIEELEPKLRNLVLEVFTAMTESGIKPFDVDGPRTEDGVPIDSGIKAHALGRLSAGRWGGSPVAPAVIDSNGRLAFKHSVRSGREPGMIHSAWPLEAGYRLILDNARRGDEPTRSCLHLTSAGELVLTDSYTASDESTQYKRTPLAEYLAQLAAEAVAARK